MMNTQRTKRTQRTRRPSRSAWLPTLIGVCLVMASGGSWAALSARFDRNMVQDGDVVTLTIERDGSSSGGEPDLSPLRKDFDVLGTSTNTQVNFINGRRSDLTRWLVRLQPRHLGTISVPPLAVGAEKTPALALAVAETSPQRSAQTGTLAIVESEIGNDVKSIRVQQQIPYTVRLYYDDAVEQGELASPQMDNAIVEQLGDEKHYSTARNGHEYHVIERRYAIAPEKSGTLLIPAATFRGRAAVAPSEGGNSDDGNSDANDLMSRMLRGTPFANDPMFRNLLAGARLPDEGRPVAARSQDITLNVLPRPAAVTGSWLPAEQVTLRDSWTENPPQFKVGEPVTRTITVDVKGLAASQIPTINVLQPEHANIYPEASDNQSRTDGEAVYGVSKQTVTYIATAEGALKVPEIDLDWWNTRTDSAGRATIPQREFNVMPGTLGVSSPPPAPVASVVASPAPRASGQATKSGMRQQLSLLADRLKEHWIAGFAAALLLASALLLVYRLRNRNLRPARTTQASARASRTGPTLREALRMLEEACAADDPQAARRALLQIGCAKWPNDPPAGIRALAERVELAREAIFTLEKNLYAASAAPWNGTALWEAFRRGPQQRKQKAQQPDDGLEPLYQTQAPI